MPRSLSRAITLILFTLLAACATTGATTPAEKRQAVLNMNYGLQEGLPDKIYHAPGSDLADIGGGRATTGSRSKLTRNVPATCRTSPSPGPA